MKIKFSTRLILVGWGNSSGKVSYPAANSQSIIRDDIEVEIQLRNANATEIWYFWHSSPKWQCPRSWKYKTVMPAEAEAAARDSVAVNCGECTVVKRKTCEMINIITIQVLLCVTD